MVDPKMTDAVTEDLRCIGVHETARAALERLRFHQPPNPDDLENAVEHVIDRFWWRLFRAVRKKTIELAQREGVELHPLDVQIAVEEDDDDDQDGCARSSGPDDSG